MECVTHGTVGRDRTVNVPSLTLVSPSVSHTVVDCAEGTVRQFAQQPYHDHRRLRMGKITKVFVTHMHGKPTSTFASGTPSST